MNQSHYELRERYQSLDTGNLIEVYLSGGLTDSAVKLIVEELKRRDINSHQEAIEKYKVLSDSLEKRPQPGGNYWFDFWWIFIPLLLGFIKWFHENYFE